MSELPTETAKKGEARASIAIVGSGPAGCYTAQMLRRRLPDAQIVVIDRLPTPYGLVRYGVAPDHQGTKQVTEQFRRLFERQGVEFLGDVQVGRDLSLDRLREAFDAVVIATGLPADRALAIPGADDPHVIGAGRLVWAFNGHPEVAPVPLLGIRVVIVGMGNVAVDLARVLTKTDAELAGSDVCDDALRRMRPHRLASIDVLSRSPVARAKFTPVMMRELGQLTAAEVTAIGDGIDGEDEQAAAVRDACAESAAHPDAELTEGEAGPSGRAAEDVPRTAIRLRFGATPERITATPDGLHVTVATADGPRTLEADAVVTAIGFTHATANAARLGEQLAAAPHAGGDTGRLFGVGWFRHGPRGTIPETRRDARAVADTVADALADPAVELGRPGLEAIRPLVPGAITYRQWLRIDAHERSHAPADRCRRKLTDLDAMRRAAAEPAG